jgi:hypothetical protein
MDVVPQDHRAARRADRRHVWQTETGAIMISASAGRDRDEARLGAGSASRHLDRRRRRGRHARRNGKRRLLVVTEPWPSMLRGIWGDPERYKETYWDKFAAQGYYFAGDGARLDEDGDVWLLGRVDEVMNVSGHRLSTTEIESALVANEAVAEAAVVGASDETTGQAVAAFVIIKQSYLAAHSPDGLAQSLRAWVGEQIGPIARPRDVYIVEELPKTRSGKIMRRLLRDVAGRTRGRRHHHARRHRGDVGDLRSGPLDVAEDDFHLDGTVEGKDRDAHGGPGMATRLTEDLAEHFAGAVDDGRLTGEVGNGCHETDDLDDTRQPIDTADGGRGGRDRVERALAGEGMSVDRGDQPRTLAHLARRRKRARHHGQLSGREDQVAVRLSRHVGRDRRHDRRQVDAELREPRRDAQRCGSSNCCAACAAASNPALAEPPPEGRLR